MGSGVIGMVEYRLDEALRRSVGDKVWGEEGGEALRRSVDDKVWDEEGGLCMDSPPVQ